MTAQGAVALTHHKTREARKDPGVGQHIDLIGAQVNDLQADHGADVVDASDVVRVQQQDAHVAQQADDACNTVRRLALAGD